jgi:hypothetical protein
LPKYVLPTLSSVTGILKFCTPRLSNDFLSNKHYKERKMLKIFLRVFVLIVLMVFPNILYAQVKANDPNTIEESNQHILELQRRIDEMQRRYDTEIRTLKEKIDRRTDQSEKQETKADIQSLRDLARAEAAKETAAETESEEQTFTSGALGLQALNPEISVTGDLLYSFSDDDASNESSDFNFRNLGVHLESWLDPYSRFKSAVEFHEGETELGEAYLTLYNVRDDLNVTLGKFRQQFGVVNRWHKHGLEQVDFPLALRKIFGEGGLNQTGLSIDWMMPPLGVSSQQLTFQVTDGSNSRLFDENTRSRPSLLAHYKNYRDLSKDTYLEWGLSGLLGWNNKWDMLAGDEQSGDKTTTVFGADLSVLWEPTEKMRYRNVEWRSEVYMLNKRLFAPDGSGTDGINAWGLYSYLQSKVSRTVDIGVRYDYYIPDTKDYANLSGPLSMSPLAVTSDGPHVRQVGPYITWWQSPFVKFRVEYDYCDSKGIDNPEHVVWLQCVFAAGPHKHERY